jgi:predicted PurR-regulated permease PerM
MPNENVISQQTLNRASFLAFFAIVIGCFEFGLGTPFITILFGNLILHYLGIRLPKRAAVFAFSILVFILFYLFVHFAQEAVRALPLAASKAIPTIVSLATSYGIQAPFENPDELKSFVREGLESQLHFLARFAQVFTKEFVYVIIALVATTGIFMTRRLDLARETYAIRHNVYSAFTEQLEIRFANFFKSFHMVMGAQVVISLVNTIFTGLFIFSLSLFDVPMPYSFVIIMITFLCGLLPIIGNLISNTVIFCIGLTQSVQLGVISLSYLIVLHKFEYFLNSKIIGGRIKNPMWLTLLSLLVGERLAGIPGMILAPVILNYCKLEGSQVAVQTPVERAT